MQIAEFNIKIQSDSSILWSLISIRSEIGDDPCDKLEHLHGHFSWENKKKTGTVDFRSVDVNF